MSHLQHLRTDKVFQSQLLDGMVALQFYGFSSSAKRRRLKAGEEAEPSCEIKDRSEECMLVLIAMQYLKPWRPTFARLLSDVTPTALRDCIGAFDEHGDFMQRR